MRKYQVNISRSVIMEIMERAKKAKKDAKAASFIENVDRYVGQERRKLSPKQFVYLCSIADVKPDSLQYTVTRRTYH